MHRRWSVAYRSLVPIVFYFPFSPRPQCLVPITKITIEAIDEPWILGQIGRVILPSSLSFARRSVQVTSPRSLVIDTVIEALLVRDASSRHFGARCKIESQHSRHSNFSYPVLFFLMLRGREIYIYIKFCTLRLDVERDVTR